MGAPTVDPVIARDYPRPIRDAYRNAIRRTSSAERHQQLLRLGEIGLAHLASLAFADYRRSRVDDPDDRVEEHLRTAKRFTMGQYVGVFRQTQKALGRQEIFGLKRYEVNVRLENAQKWISAVRAVEHAQRIGASDIRRVVEEGLKQPAKGVRWLSFWDELVAYRNRIAHADAHGWPVDVSGYFDAMTPPLEAALLDALRTEYIGFVLLEYPVAELLEVRRSTTGWVLRFDGEYHGVPLLEEIPRDAPPESWESDVGGQYVLERVESGWAPHSRYFDLAVGVPPAISGAIETPAGAADRSLTEAPAQGRPLQPRIAAGPRGAGEHPTSDDAPRSAEVSASPERIAEHSSRPGGRENPETIEGEAPTEAGEPGTTGHAPERSRESVPAAGDAQVPASEASGGWTHKGWTEAQLRRVLPAASSEVQSILRYIASHPGCTSPDIAGALGFKSERSVGRYLNGLTRTARQFGVHDRGTVRWPLEWPGKRGNYDMYDMPAAVRAVVLDVLGSA